MPLTVNSPLLEWQIFLACAKRLWLTDLALEAGSGHLEDAIDAFREELAFTRKVLAEPDMLLIDKLVLGASLRMDLAFISDVARNVSLSDAQYSALAQLVSPLTVEERSLAPVFARIHGLCQRAGAARRYQKFFCSLSSRTMGNYSKPAGR